ncbi:hypothetical protein VcTj87_22560 [Vibrio comitans]
MSKPEPTPNMVEAVVIDPSAIQKQAQQIRKEREAASKAEQERIRKLKEQSKQLEKNRKAEEERIRRLAQEKAESEKKTREAEKQRQLKEKQRKEEEQRTRVAEAERKKKEQATKKAEAERIAKVKAAEEASKQAAKAEADRVAKEKAAKEATEKARKAEQEKIAQEKAAKEATEKAKKEQARLAQLERERKEQEAALSDIFSGLEAEQESNSTARNRFVADEVSRYGAIYKQMIQDALLLEDSYRGKQCQVNLRLLGAGSSAIVSDVNTISGDNRLCSATKRAIAKVGSFPLPSDPSVVEQLKNIKLTVAPE